jgi:hypothetical protein
VTAQAEEFNFTGCNKGIVVVELTKNNRSQDPPFTEWQSEFRELYYAAEPHLPAEFF